jgi:hypothetical protein
MTTSRSWGLLLIAGGGAWFVTCGGSETTNTTTQGGAGGETLGSGGSGTMGGSGAGGSSGSGGSSGVGGGDASATTDGGVRDAEVPDAGNPCRRAEHLDVQCKDAQKPWAYACVIPNLPPSECTLLTVGNATDWYCCPQR